jgi:hypothetical protein
MIIVMAAPDYIRDTHRTANVGAVVGKISGD